MRKYWTISSKGKDNFNHTLNTYVHDGWMPVYSTFNTIYNPVSGMMYTILLYKDVPKKC